MKFRFLLALVALSPIALDLEAGPLRRRGQSTYQYPSYQQPTYQYPSYQEPSYQPVGEYTASYAPVVPAGSVPAGDQAAWSAGSGDGLDEVNAKRASRGLRPFVRDDSLTHAARACASFRAQYGMFGHTSNDFAFLPAGASASSAGCAAYPASYGWMSCCVYEGYTYAGAAWVQGQDGRRYMHLFVR